SFRVRGLCATRQPWPPFWSAALSFFCRGGPAQNPHQKKRRKSAALQKANRGVVRLQRLLCCYRQDEVSGARPPPVSASAVRGVILTDRGEAPAAPGNLDAWVLATAPRAVAYAAALLRDAVLAEDVVQDCYCRLLQKA